MPGIHWATQPSVTWRTHTATIVCVWRCDVTAPSLQTLTASGRTQGLGVSSRFYHRLVPHTHANFTHITCTAKIGKIIHIYTVHVMFAGIRYINSYMKAVWGHAVCPQRHLWSDQKDNLPTILTTGPGGKITKWKGSINVIKSCFTSDKKAQEEHINIRSLSAVCNLSACSDV